MTEDITFAPAACASLARWLSLSPVAGGLVPESISWIGSLCTMALVQIERQGSLFQCSGPAMWCRGEGRSI